MPSRYDSLCDRIIANSVLSPTPEEQYRGTPCWVWIGPARRDGRPVISMRAKSGPRKGKVITYSAYRISVREFTNRRVTPKMVIMHMCNNKHCVNPDHLRGGTQKQNVQHCVKSGRHKTPFRKGDA